jgi:hypothetical protein
MTTRSYLLAALGLGTALAGVLAAGDKPAPKKPGNVDPVLDRAQGDPLLRARRDLTEENIDEYRRKYPFASLEDRLKFDPEGRKRVTKALAAAALDVAKWEPAYRTPDANTIPAAVRAVLDAERHLNYEGHFERTEALARIHSAEVQKFVTNPGFGHMRMHVTRFGTTPEKYPGDWSEADRGDEVKLPADGDFFTPNPDKKGPTLPATAALASFHTATAHEFARPDSWGLVKDKKQVAGFLPHALAFAPSQSDRRRLDRENPTKDETGRVTGYPEIERWAVRKVELVGILMHDSPVVYVTESQKLPTMADVANAKTRELSDFEAKGLKQLAAGKDAVVVDATTNQVRMVGAIRMAQACLKCHDGARGDLLGAFSYDLVRDPAFRAKE